MTSEGATISGDNTRIYQMLGKRVRLNYDLSDSSAWLKAELALYPELPLDIPADLTINCSPVTLPKQGMRNPQIHLTWDNGIIAQYPPATVRIDCDHATISEVTFAVHSPQSAFGRVFQRLRSTQYATSAEAIGQIFHELVLIPSIYFDTHRFLIHAAAIADYAGQVTLIGGTGGVGKTSLSLELCMKHEYLFLADDMSVVSAQGYVEPNLAFPKIYGYNMVDNLELQRRVLSKRRILDLVHWQLYSKRGLNRVRRRMSPRDLYDGYSRNGGQLKRYFILVRTDCDRIEVTPLTGSAAADLSLTVLETEQVAIHNQLRWHLFNALAGGLTPCVRLPKVLERWHDMAQSVFESAECSLVHIPLQLDHNSFKQQVIPILTNS